LNNWKNNIVHRIGPGPVLQYQSSWFQIAPASSDRAPSQHCSDRAAVSRPCQRASDTGAACCCCLHVRRIPSSPSPALIRCELHAEDFPSPFHSLHAASFLCSPRARDQPLSTEPYRCALSARAAAPRGPPPPSSPEPTTLSLSRDAEESYRSCATTAKSVRDASPHRSSSSHICTTPSTARTPNAFPPQQPAASDRWPPPPLLSPPADHPPP
jgi:hypothetical protein